MIVVCGSFVLFVGCWLLVACLLVRLLVCVLVLLGCSFVLGYNVLQVYCLLFTVCCGSLLRLVVVCC